MNELLGRSGIYKIRNLINGKIYVGSTQDFSFRKKEHFWELKNNKHYNQYLQRAFNKYGEENFVFEILEECNIENLLVREQYYLDTLQPFDEVGYNVNPLAGKYYNIPVPVAKLSLQGELIEVYPSMKEAAIDTYGYENHLKSATDISNCCRGQQRVARGYIWMYYDEETFKQDFKMLIAERIGKLKLVEKINPKTGERIKLYTGGVSEIEKEMGYAVGNSALRVCIKEERLFKDYYYRYYVPYTEKTAKYYLGCDIGKNGAFALIREDNKFIFTFKLPVIGTEIDVNRITSYLRNFRGDIKQGVMEDVHSIFNVSAKSNFQFGRALGIIEGGFAGFEIPFLKVAPKTWQKVAHLGIPEIKLPLKVGQKNPSNDTKAMSLLAATRLFPTQDFLATEKSKKPHDGIVDALLIAHYCKNVYK